MGHGELFDEAFEAFVVFLLDKLNDGQSVVRQSLFQADGFLGIDILRQVLLWVSFAILADNALVDKGFQLLSSRNQSHLEVVVELPHEAE